MKIDYKNKKLERFLIGVNVLTAATVVASFIVLFGFVEPLLPVIVLFKVQNGLLLVFIAGKIIRLFNAESIKEFFIAKWFDIPLLLALGLIFFGSRQWFDLIQADKVRHIAVGVYLLIEVITKVCITSLNLATYVKNPIRTLITSFLVLIFVGAGLLMLPAASNTHASLPFIDALFTATSAVTTTGLIVVDTGGYYSLFGQITILILFQIGGLGYMTLISSAMFFNRGRLSLGERVLLNESVMSPQKVDILAFLMSIVIFTFIFELLGALALGYYWQRYFDSSKAFYIGLFHSVSAFCTAGFSLFPDSLTSYRGSTLLNITVSVICITGGIGFLVLYDIYELSIKTIKRVHPRHLSVHTKLAIVVSFLLILVGTIVIFFSEKTISSVGLKERFLNAGFQALSSSSTTGFNTVDVGKVSQTSLFTIILLMFVGASPGGTGGGIKTTTFGLMVLSVYAVVVGREDVNVFKGRAAPKVITRAFGVALASVFILVAAVFVLTITENASFLKVLFEASSALGTVGLSTGITAQLSFVGKIVIAITMLIGRVGALAIGFSVVGKSRRINFEYADAEILVG